MRGPNVSPVYPDGIIFTVKLFEGHEIKFSFAEHLARKENLENPIPKENWDATIQELTWHEKEGGLSAEAYGIQAWRMLEPKHSAAVAMRNLHTGE